MLQEAIKGSYVEYKYHRESYSGSKIPEKAFPKYEMQAEAFMHRITFGRVKRLPEIPDEVKKAICAMAEVSYQEDKKTPGVKSETIDGYSATFADTGSSARDAEMYQEAKNFLSDTGLLFRGRSRKYDC